MGDNEQPTRLRCPGAVYLKRTGLAADRIPFPTLATELAAPCARHLLSSVVSRVSLFGLIPEFVFPSRRLFGQLPEFISAHADTLFGLASHANPWNEHGPIRGVRGSQRTEPCGPRFFARSLLNQFMFSDLVPDSRGLGQNSLRESSTEQTGRAARTYRFSGQKAMRNLASIIERPMCAACKHRMGLVRISSGERGFEERTFECGTCHRIEKATLPVDPMKTDALGWLASELRPPR